MNLIHDPAAPVVRGPSPLDIPTIEVSSEITVTAPGQAPSANGVDYKDGFFDGQISAGTIAADRISIPSQSPTIAGDTSITIDPTDAAVCSISADGKVHRATTGICKVNVKAPGIHRQVSLNVAYTPSGNYFSGVVKYKDGSLRKYLHDQQEALFAATLPGRGQRFYTDGVGPEGSTAFNPSLITGRSVPGFTPFDATPVRNSKLWLTDHVYFTRYGVSHGVYPTSAQRALDQMTILHFGTRQAGEPVMKLLPSNWRTFVGQISDLTVLPILGCMAHSYDYSSGAEDKYWICPVDITSGWESAGLNGVAYGPDLKAPGGQHYTSDPAKAIYPSNSARVRFSRTTSFNSAGRVVTNVICTGGDSDSPLFIGINGKLVYIGTVYGYGGAIDFFPDRVAELQALVNSICDQNSIPHETLTTLDLAAEGFTAFP